MQTFFESLCVQIPEIYLPKDGVDLTKWSVVVCDQYTSQPDYRDGLKDIALKLGSQDFRRIGV